MDQAEMDRLKAIRDAREEAVRAEINTRLEALRAARVAAEVAATAEQQARQARVPQPGLWQTIAAAVGAAAGANARARRGGVDWIGGRLWIQRAGARPPRAAAPRNMIGNAGGVPGPAAQAFLPDWCSADALAQAQAFANALPAAGKCGLQGWAGFLDEDCNTKIPDWAGPFARMPLGIGTLIISIAHVPFRLLDTGLALIPFHRNLDPVKKSAMYLWGFVLGVANKFTGGFLAPLVRSLELERNFIAPWQVQDTSTAVARHLRDQIRQSETYQWGAVNGDCPPTVQAAIDTQQAWYDPEMQWQAYLRGIIHSEGELRIALRKCGFIDQRVTERWIATHYQLLDRGTILEALNRLRPGRDPSGVTYTEAEARKDLRALGYQDRTVDIIIALSKHPPNFRQLQKPYVDGLMELEQLQEFQRDDGLSETGIETLAPFLRFERVNHQRLLSGAPAPAALTKGVADGQISPGDYAGEIAAQGYPPSTSVGGLVEAAAQRLRSYRAACIAGIERALSGGTSTTAEAAIALRECGVDAGIADEMIARWVIERANGSKPASVGDLCTWASKGLIPVAEYVQRLLALGYSRKDADRIILVCGMKAQQQQEKRLEQNAKKRAAEAQRRINAARGIVSGIKGRQKVDTSGAQAKIGAAQSAAKGVKARAKADAKIAPAVAAAAVAGAAPPIGPGPAPPSQ
jgi:hypothetical protein